MTTKIRRVGRKEAMRQAAPQGVVVEHGPARMRREIQWGLRPVPSPAERRRMSRRAA